MSQIIFRRTAQNLMWVTFNIISDTDFWSITETFGKKICAKTLLQGYFKVTDNFELGHFFFKRLSGTDNLYLFIFIEPDDAFTIKRKLGKGKK